MVRECHSGRIIVRLKRPRKIINYVIHITFGGSSPYILKEPDITARGNAPGWKKVI